MENLSIDEIAQRDDAEAAKVFAAMATLAAYGKSETFDHTVVAEAAAEHKLDADSLAAIIMQYFDWDTESIDGRIKLKSFLMALASYLGPDHVENFRKSAAFMVKVESF